MDVLALVLGIVIGVLLGVLGTLLLLRRRLSATHPALVAAEHREQLLAARADADTVLSQALATERQVQAELLAKVAAADAATVALRESLEQQQVQRRELLAQQRSDQQEREQREQREQHVLQALAPVRKTLEDMQAKVADLEVQRNQQYGSLAEQLKQAQLSDEHLRKTTESLAGALRSNSTRGVWGETQLRRVVEAAGMMNHVDFAEQSHVVTEGGAGRPDLTVLLPGGKFLPIDAKVPLEHYLEASDIPVTATGAELAHRTALLDRHVKSLRGHVDALGKKAYWEGFSESPEFVIAFIPSEALLSAALDTDAELLEYAFKRRVALASPVSLFAVLKTIDHIWQQQAVSDEAKKLFALGNELYGRIGGMAKHADDLRRAIARTVAAYNSFAGTLESRVLVTARKFPGINDSKLDTLAAPEPIHEVPRALTSSELIEALPVASSPLPSASPNTSAEAALDGTDPDAPVHEAPT